MNTYQRLSIEMVRFDKIAEYVRYLGRMTFPELVEANGMIYINMPDEDIIIKDVDESEDVAVVRLSIHNDNLAELVATLEG